MVKPRDFVIFVVVLFAASGANADLFLTDGSVAPPTGEGGALLEPLLDGHYWESKDGNRFSLNFPPNRSHLGHRGVRIGDVLPFSGYRGVRGYCEVRGFTQMGLHVKRIERPKGAPEINPDRSIIWFDGWSKVPGGLILVLPDKSKRPDAVVIEFKRRNLSTGDYFLYKRGEFSVGHVFKSVYSDVTLEKIVQPDPQTRRLGWVEFSTKLKRVEQ